MALKFVINDGNIIARNVKYHYQLSIDNSKTKGGGYFYIDRINKILWLYSKSHEFGSVNKEKIEKAFKEGKVEDIFKGHEIRFSYSEFLPDIIKNNDFEVIKPFVIQ